MKTVKLFASAFAALVLAAGCSKVQEIDHSPVQTVITAGLENTKAELQSDGKKVYWQAGDAISVCGFVSRPLDIATPIAIADFIFDVGFPVDMQAVYPSSIWYSEGTVKLPALQGAGTNASFGQNALPMVAYASGGNNLIFKAVAAVIKVPLVAGKNAGTVSYVEFSGNNGEQVCGLFGVDYATGELTPATDPDDVGKVVRVTVDKALGEDASNVYIAVPPGNYSAGFTVKVVGESGSELTKSTGAVTLAAGKVYSTPASAVDGPVTIKDFAQEYVKILDVWENNVGTINRVSNWELAADGDEDVVENAHYVPSDFTITVGDKTYNTGDMFETALRSYLLLRGWDGNETVKNGYGNIPTATPVSMSAAVPATHGYTWSRPLIESSNGGYLYKKVGGKEVYGQVDPLILDNWAQRSVNFQSGKPVTNFCTYPRDPITNYVGCFSAGRALITYAFFFKYMLDNDLTRADGLGADVEIRSELFGLETAAVPDDPAEPEEPVVSEASIKDFAEAYVGILDVWENTTGTIDMVTGENYTGGSFNVENAHYVPKTTTITVGGKTYNTADMFETALRSYLLVRGYNGLDQTNYGAGSISALPGGALGMSATTVPETHGYYWGTSPYNETAGNGGHFCTTGGVHSRVDIDVLDNWAMRSLNFQKGQAITNLCTYPRSPITGYTGCFCSMRGLITYAFFFKYMLDNKLDKADGIAADTILRTELFGDE